MVAVGVGPGAAEVTDALILLGRVLDAPIEVLHVLETDVVGDQVVDTETAEAARMIADTVVEAALGRDRGERARAAARGR